RKMARRSTITSRRSRIQCECLVSACRLYALLVREETCPEGNQVMNFRARRIQRPGSEIFRQAAKNVSPSSHQVSARASSIVTDPLQNFAELPLADAVPPRLHSRWSVPDQTCRQPADQTA